MKVCTSCFNDFELMTFIETSSTERGQCKWCGSKDSYLIDFEEIEEFFVDFLDIFIPEEEGIPLYELINKDWNFFSEKSSQKELLDEILTILHSGCTYNMPVNYVSEIVESISYWDELRENLKWSQRFLTNIGTMIELGWDGFFNRQTTLTNEDSLYRARIHSSDRQEPFDISLMGCPPKDSTSSGRANPLGIPYLYLSKLPETTFYETRALYLDEVSIGIFKVKQDQSIVLVDFTEENSTFANATNILQYAKGVLLKKKISSDLSKPLRRYDSELEYIPTQFICEFIRYITNADGIIFESSLHVGGINVVIFEEEKVECISVEKHQVTSVNIRSSIFK